MDIGTLTVTMGANTAGLARAQQAMIKLQQQTLKSVGIMSSSLNALSAKMDKLGTSSKAATQRITAIEKPAVSAMARITNSLTQANSALQRFGYIGLTTLTLPITMAGKAAFNMAKDYEFSIQKIVGLTGVAQSVVNAWEKELLAMPSKVGKGPKELAEALYFISSSGIKGAEAMDVLRMSSKAAAAGLGETQTVADLLTSALNAYRGTGLTAAYASDVLVAAVREGKAEATGFASAMGQIIPIASQLGVSFDQVAGGMAAITLTGSTSSQAAVYLKGIFNSLLKATSQGESALKKVGTSYGELRNILGNQGIIPMLQKLRDIQTKYGDELLSDVLPNIRALTGYLSLTGKNFQYNTDLMKRVTESTGSLGKAFASVSDTIKMRYDKAIMGAQESMISLGKSLAATVLPYLEKLAKKLQELTTWFNSLSEAEQRHKIIILAIAAALPPLSLLFSSIVWIVRGAITAFNGLAVAMKFLYTNPYALAAGGILLAIGGLIKYVNHVKDVARAHDTFNTAVVRVNGSLKKMKEITSADVGEMSLVEIGRAMGVVQQEWVKAENLFNQGKTNKEGFSWFEKLFGANRNNDKYIETQLNKIEQLKNQYNLLGDAYYDVWQKSLLDNEIKKTQLAINNYKKLQEEITKAHRLILDQYDAQLKKEERALKMNERIREMEKADSERMEYGKFFRGTAGVGARYNLPEPITTLDNQYAKGLVTYKQYLDDKYRMDIINAGESADARMKIETEHIDNIRAYKRSELESYLNSTSNAISTISNLIEASKQKELSAVGQNAKARERIEKDYMQKQKAWAIAQAIINGALAITNMIANVPMSVLNPSTWVGIGIAAASTAAQVAIIAGQKMKEGGVVPAGYPNDTYPALLTSGEMVTPPGKLSGIQNQFDQEERLIAEVTADQINFILTRRNRKQHSYS